MNMKFWRDWLLLWALVPVFCSFFLMAVNKEINASDPNAAWHQLGSIFVAIAALIAIPVVPYFLLRAHLPRYGAGEHFAVVLLIMVGWIAIILLAITDWPFAISSDFFQWDRDFSIASRRLASDAPIALIDVLSLPWWKVLLPEFAMSVAIYTFPALFICVLADRPKKFLAIGLFMALAGCAATLSDELFQISKIRELELGALNGRRWLERLGAIGTWSASSVIGASISAIGINNFLCLTSGQKTAPRMLRSYALVPLVITGLWGAAFLVDYIFGPKGIRSGFAEVRRVLSSAPDKDQSVGQSILQFSHELEANTYRTRQPQHARIELAPDGSSLLVREAHGKNGSRWAAFELESGTRIASLGQPFAKYEASGELWVRNGKYLIIRRRGSSRKETKRYSTRYNSKLELYTVPDYKLVTTWELPSDICFHETSSRAGMVEEKSGSLGLLCHPPYPLEQGSVLAVRLTIPKLSPLQIRRVRAEETNGYAFRLIEVRQSLYALVQPVTDSDVFRLTNISSPEWNVELDNPRRLNRGGGLTFQNSRTSALGEETIGLLFCGAAERVDNPPTILSHAPWGPSFCRMLKYDITDGSYLGADELPEIRFATNVKATETVSLQNERWKFTGIIDRAHKKGELIVRDLSNGQVAQTLHTKAKVPILVTADGKRLITYNRDDGRVSVYDIRPQD